MIRTKPGNQAIRDRWPFPEPKPAHKRDMKNNTIPEEWVKIAVRKPRLFGIIIK